MSAEYERDDNDKLSARALPSIVAAAQELRSPLALIRQLSLSLEDGDIGDDERKDMLRQISLTSEKALRLAGDLTVSSKMKDGLFKLEPINAKQLCEDIVNELTPAFLAHECDVRLISRKAPSLLVANRDLLRRIIISLSDNAMRYAGKESSVEIRINTINKGKTVRLGVRDYGPALPRNTIKVLQNKIMNSSNITIDARPRSSGLSLYIAGQFADVINGEIGVTRHRDGSTFYIDLHASHQLSLI
jgi:two-component system sensor histidine kinase ChvG